MAVEYRNDSPYANTNAYSYYLDILTPRRIPAKRDDVLHTLTLVHQNRPDLLAFDLYGNSNLWWVFMDPVWDFRAGVKFYIPKKDTVEAALGI